MYSPWYDREQLPRFARGLVAWLVSARHFGMHLHDHHVCAHGPTVLTNPELSKIVAERILCVLQVRTQTIVTVKNIVQAHCILYMYL